MKVTHETTLQELIKVNQRYIEWLRTTKGKEAAEKYIEELKEEVSKAPKVGTYIEVPVAKVSDE